MSLSDSELEEIAKNYVPKQEEKDGHNSSHVIAFKVLTELSKERNITLCDGNAVFKLAEIFLKLGLGKKEELEYYQAHKRGIQHDLNLMRESTKPQRENRREDGYQKQGD